MTRVAWAAFASFFLAACGGEPPPEAGGILSLNPCLDAILVEVAPPGRIAALSHYSRDPVSSSVPRAVALRLPVTGGTVEEVLALDPELVLADPFLPPATRAALERQGIAVQTFGMATNVEESVEQVRTIAALANRPERGEALAARIVAAAHPAMPDERPSAVLWQPGGIVAGEGALVARLMDRAGLANHAASRGLQQADYLSLERMLADPPELLLVAGDQRGQHHPALGAIPTMRVEPYAPNLTYCGGPTIIRAMDRLREARAETIASRQAER